MERLAQRKIEPEAKAALAKLVDAISEAKRLRRANPKTGERLSFRRIAAELASKGYLSESGKTYNPKTVRAMVNGPTPKTSDA